MAWVPRFPELKENLSLSNGPFGSILTTGAIGAFLGLLTVGHIVHKYGVKIVFTPDEIVRTADGATLQADGAPVEVGRVIKMSKSKKNVVDPMNIIAQFGADTARWFVMSDSPPERDVEWTASGAEGAYKHLNRVWTLCSRIGEMPADHAGEGDDDLRRATARAIRTRPCRW